MPFIPPTPSTNGALSPQDGIPPDTVFSPNTTGWAQNQNGFPSTVPQRPPMSPVTPTLSNPQLARTDENGQRIIPPPVNTNFQEESFEQRYLSEPPPPVPISESEEPDVIALRAASSILQRQREKAEQDIRKLDEIRRLAMEDPEGFIQSLLAKPRLKPEEQQFLNFLGPTILNDVRNPTDIAIPPEPPNAESPVENGGDEGVYLEEGQERKDSAATSQVLDEKFPSLPAAQNVFRTPAINWGKYHVIGESLEHIHQAQVRRPVLDNSKQDPSNSKRASEHIIAGPLNENQDPTAGFHPMETRRASHRHSEGAGTQPVDSGGVPQDESSVKSSEEISPQSANNPADALSSSDDQNGKRKVLRFGSDWKTSTLVKAPEQTPVGVFTHKDGSPGRLFVCPVKACTKATQGYKRIDRLYKYASIDHRLDEWVDEYKVLEENRRREAKRKKQREKEREHQAQLKAGTVLEQEQSGLVEQSQTSMEKN